MTSLSQNRRIIRPVTLHDYEEVVDLYLQLTEGRPVASGAEGRTHFEKLLAHPGTVIFGAEVDRHIRSMATLHLLPNMTSLGRPYALVENVVTHEAYRGIGLGRAVLEALIAAAWAEGAYKIMLLTGKLRTAVQFYEKIGFSADQKHGMVLRRD
ncbi:GNAT family N-acetyltransferase [Pseudovibrio sp. SPO723]|uniref:GNAT family N-acetyltransferase n=1 Tax=Nesiotobacter zosterae TaxID=392721 RepID=UPI0029C17A70|nr:GNAT family N-acetyltransferase [Pseudovibrio sp. SPO723]MDX5593495.1 GNAT family N-acetyltransferase [Pseudovibrio sp. SPO723]